MPIVPMSRLLNHGRSEGYATGAFLCMNNDMITAVLRAAEAENAPVAIRLHPDVRRITAFSTLAAVARERAAELSIPVGLSLDHGESLADTTDAFRAGCTSVMLDAAEAPLEENIARVRAVAEVMNPHGVVVEAALGRMPHGQVQKPEDMATPEDACRLVEEGGARLLAPAVGNIHGTAHGEDKGEPSLDIARIQALTKASGVPICLHGGSGIPLDQSRAAAEAGVALVIIYTDVVGAFDEGLRAVLGTQQGSVNLLHALEPAIDAASEVVRDKIRAFGGNGRAPAALAAA